MYPIRILVTGTFESGKTTLVNHFLNEASVAVVSEVARDILSIYPELQNHTEFQQILFEEQLRREEEAVRSGKQIILCDRGTLDIIAFSNALGVPIHEEWRLNTLNRYQHIVMCSPEDVAFDGEDFGLNTYTFREQIHSEIRDVINEIRSLQPFITITEIGGDINHRKKLMEGIISNHIINIEGGPTYKERFL